MERLKNEPKSLGDLVKEISKHTKSILAVAALGSSVTLFNSGVQEALAASSVERELQEGREYLGRAETNDQSPPRNPFVFESMVEQMNSTLRIPENPRITSNFSQAQAYFGSQLGENRFGLFLDGGPKHLYVVQKQNGQIIAVRQMDVTTGAKGFSNVAESNGTPFGPLKVQSLSSGRLGEVVSHNSAEGCKKGNLINSFQKGHSKKACIVTEYIAIDNKRGVGFHGTNYELNTNGELRLNEAASGGCIRLFNADIAAIKANGYISKSMPVYIAKPGQKKRKQQTTVRTQKPKTESTKTLAPKAPEVLPPERPVLDSDGGIDL